MEHIELAGIHSGDSACVIPPVSIPPKHLDTIEEYTRRIASELNVVGLMNIQYAICQGHGLRAGGQPAGLAHRAAGLQGLQHPDGADRHAAHAGQEAARTWGSKRRPIPHFGVKEAVFPFNMFPEVDPLLGPEMRSTGEVLGMADSFGLAFYKAQEAAEQRLPLEGTVLITVADRDKPAVLEVARRFAELGFRIMATEGTHDFLAAARHRRRADPQDARGPAQHRRRHQERRDPAGHQHAGGQG